jgi:transposase
MLTDEQWELVDPYLPRSTARTGRPPADRRLMFEAAVHVLTEGCRWRGLPERFGPWQTAYHRFNRWRRDGVLDRLARAMLERVDAAGLIDWSLFCVDGTSVRAAACAAGARRAAPRPANRRTTRSGGRRAGSGRSSTSRAAGTGSR